MADNIFADLEDTEFWDNACKDVGSEKYEHPEQREVRETMGGQTQSVSNVRRFTCDRCHGTGELRIYRRGGGFGQIPEIRKCWTCGGHGKTKLDAASRRRAREQRKARKQRIAAENAGHAAKFLDDNPEILEWFKRQLGRVNVWEFAQSLHDQLWKKGELSTAQIAVIERMIEKDKARAAERANRPADANVEAADKLIAAFRSARDNGLKYPKLVIGTLTFSMAGDNSKNPGCLYVKDNGEYAGKVTPKGEFFAIRACSDETKQAVAEIGSDPLKAAQVHGKKTGRCSCCNRELTNPESVELGIGPICRDKWGM